MPTSRILRLLVLILLQNREFVWYLRYKGDPVSAWQDALHLKLKDIPRCPEFVESVGSVGISVHPFVLSNRL